MPTHGTQASLYIGVGFALAAAAVSSLRLFDRTGQALQGKPAAGE
jgi:hypothetical protein